MDKLIEKREKEKVMVSKMIRIYCHANHHSKELCHECSALETYAHQRIDHCPMMESKTFCSACTVHCYAPQMREKIKIVMRFSGPRMLFHDPVMAIKHLFVMIKTKHARNTSKKERR